MSRFTAVQWCGLLVAAALLSAPVTIAVIVVAEVIS